MRQISFNYQVELVPTKNPDKDLDLAYPAMPAAAGIKVPPSTTHTPTNYYIRVVQNDITFEKYGCSGPKISVMHSITW